MQKDQQQQVVKSAPRKQRSNLPKPITAILKDWLARHKRHPYPNEEEKAQLVQQTGLARNQISNWFINARRRILQTMLDQADEDDEDESPCGPLPAFGVFGKFLSLSYARAPTSTTAAVIFLLSFL